MPQPAYSVYLVETDRLVAGATAHAATMRATLMISNATASMPAVQGILEALEGTLEELQQQRGIIARLVEMSTRHD